jgi:hypothetical protein
MLGSYVLRLFESPFLLSDNDKHCKQFSTVVNERAEVVRIRGVGPATDVWIESNDHHVLPIA